MATEKRKVIFNFDNLAEVQQWRTIDDVVMGGVTKHYKSRQAGHGPVHRHGIAGELWRLCINKLDVKILFIICHLKFVWHLSFGF